MIALIEKIAKFAQALGGSTAQCCKRHYLASVLYFENRQIIPNVSKDVDRECPIAVFVYRCVQGVAPRRSPYVYGAGRKSSSALSMRVFGDT
jgi:hypothetical protein